MSNLRQDNFKIGTFHGTLTPTNSSKEAKFRNVLYLIGNLVIQVKNDLLINIRLIGYEIPLGNREERIDLLGYDSEKNPYIIELKTDSSTEKLPDIINQINNYSRIFPSIVPFIEDEFYNKFFFNLKFTNDIRKIILAPREFFQTIKDKSIYPSVDEVMLCSISKVKTVFDEKKLIIEDKLAQYETITLKVENK